MKKCEKANWFVHDKTQQTPILQLPVLSWLMMRWLSPGFLGLILFTSLAGTGKNCNGAAPDTFELLLPGNIPLTFQAVYLGLDGEKVFDSKRIKLGSRQENAGYKAQLTDTLLAGSFTGDRKGKTDWLYYLGRTEIEQRQWSAVMRWWDEKNGKQPEPINSSKLPQTGKTLSEIYTFLEALNTWMVTHEANKLPSYKNAKAFCRLPTEAEWEFAARGGIMVQEDVFDLAYPYKNENGENQLGGFEWYRSTSGNNVKECGSPYLKPNPVGLYDMLGNVEELTFSLFGPEYQQGRFGSLVIRGSNFSTDQKDMTVSARTEYETHTSNGEILRPTKVGFRLALSTRITSSGYLSEKLDEEYEKYSKAKGLTRPGPSGKSSPTAQATEDFIERFKAEQQRLQGINEELLLKLDTKEEEYRKTKIELAQKDNRLNYMDTELQRKDQQIETLRSQSVIAERSQSVIAEESKKAKDKLESKSMEIIGQQQKEIARLQGVVAAQQDTVVNVKSMEQELAQLKQEIIYSKQRDKKSDYEISKNLHRIRYSEKKLLEAYMRLASYNLFSALDNLKRIEAKRKAGLSAKEWENNQKEAKNMIGDYLNHVRNIIDDTQEDLFQEVKAEIIVWLKGNKVVETQIKSLDLIERHVKEMRKGKFPDADQLYTKLLTEPEMK